MGIFDGVFNNQPQVDASRAQIGGINQGLNDLSGLFDLGRQALTTNTGNANTALTNATGQATGAVGNAVGGANNVLGSNFNAGANALTSGYNTAQGALGSTFGNATNALSNNYYAGISPFLSNFATANQGSQTLADALGLNGPGGNARAVAAFKSNPSYQFGLDQGEAAIAAQAQKAGMGASGNALNAADEFAQNYANSKWGDYISNLQPYLSLLTPSAGGIQQGFSGLGTGLSNAYQNLGMGLSGNAMNIGQMLDANARGLGTASSGNIMQGGGLTNADLMALGGGLSQNFTGLGQGLNQSLTTQGNAFYGGDTSKGNAQANADLANAQANTNLLNTLGQGAKAIFGMLSDETMKDDIERVGELFDGQPIYRYREKGDPRHKIGLIAQEVEERNPDAVVQFTPHVKGVDYKRATDKAAEIFRFLEAA